MSYLREILPSEMVVQIVKQVQEDQEPQWVRLGPDHAYYLVSTKEPSPLMRVCQRTREVMIVCNFTLTLKSKFPDEDYPDLLTSFNYAKDTLYLDPDIQSFCDGLSLTSLLAAIPEDQIRGIQHLAIAFYPFRNPDNLRESALQFTTDLGHFSALRSLRIVPQESLGTDSVADILAKVASELQSPRYYYMTDEENISGADEPRLGEWLDVIRSYTDRRNISVDVAPM